jgi:hypothetical protein
VCNTFPANIFGFFTEILLTETFFRFPAE